MATFYFDHSDKKMKVTSRNLMANPGIEIFAKGPASIRRNMAGSYYAIDIGDMKEAIVATPTIIGKTIGMNVRAHGLARVDPRIYTIEMAHNLYTLAKSEYLHRLVWDCVGLTQEFDEVFASVTTIRVNKSNNPKKPTLRLVEAQLTNNRSFVFLVPVERSMGAVARYKIYRQGDRVTTVYPKGI